MKKQSLKFQNKDELDILVEDIKLDAKEMYILGFLKGFDRGTLKKWNKEGLIDFSVKVI